MSSIADCILKTCRAAKDIACEILSNTKSACVENAPMRRGSEKMQQSLVKISGAMLSVGYLVPILYLNEKPAYYLLYTFPAQSLK
jgi:hypothetical protein